MECVKGPGVPPIVSAEMGKILKAEVAVGKFYRKYC
jgi:hypothetical protein